MSRVKKTVINGSQKKATKEGGRKLLMTVMMTAADALKISLLELNNCPTRSDCIQFITCL